MQNHGFDFARGGFNTAQAMAGQQGSHLAGMIGQVNKAVDSENDTRVAKARELTRMQHEIAMKQKELDAILARIDAARQMSGPKPRAAFPGGAIY
jgi:hypothetical protein